MELKVIRDPGDARVDIVFVHGWHGEQPGWTSAAKSVFWPEKLFASKVSEARVFSFEYDVTLETFWNEEDLITELSNELMDQLMDQRTEPEKEKRAVILVAHCLGGLICENALVQGAEHNDRKALVSCVKGLLLLGTPHYHPGVLSEANKYFELAGEEAPSEFGLEEKSDWVMGIPREFAKLRAAGLEMDIQCFYEGSPTDLNGKGVKIVEMALARCPDGPPAERLAANHVKMSQFEDENDRDFVKVLRVLKKWVAKVPAPEKDGGTTVNNVSHASFAGSTNSGYQLGQNVGNQSGFVFGRA
ncbi:hypothetical protein BO86DRAFT_367344 [Aspergillus japonicus CBS 114.51]|uniref:GPI inositol-deacylase n=1 Tax=Aspergillus japonicus CBS 114.51 TaxID=1448312 RepID=A0A8T8WTC7_ASPJA|nr:hypothetical protein BO86DRAFT_367344 [Aspergillus japonicus CBS 114.51]RAH79097.1 hypothetical protein BO86DRAFT_367344 [Aspergillus japonicus CBS 114.51]